MSVGPLGQIFTYDAGHSGPFSLFDSDLRVQGLSLEETYRQISVRMVNDGSCLPSVLQDAARVFHEYGKRLENRRSISIFKLSLVTQLVACGLFHPRVLPSKSFGDGTLKTVACLCTSRSFEILDAMMERAPECFCHAIPAQSPEQTLLVGRNLCWLYRISERERGGGSSAHIFNCVCSMVKKIADKRSFFRVEEIRGLLHEAIMTFRESDNHDCRVLLLCVAAEFEITCGNIDGAKTYVGNAFDLCQCFRSECKDRMQAVMRLVGCTSLHG